MSFASTPDDDLVATVRRADWRFLLPEPTLRRVAYVAPHEPAMTAALQVLSDDVSLVATPPIAGDAGPFDVAVITSGAPRSVGTARALLRDDGWLYAEMAGPAVGTWSRALRRGGFDEVEQFWLWPDAPTCREIVPLSRPALRASLGRRDPGARLRLRSRLAELLAASGLFRLAMRRAAVIGRAS